MTHVLWDTLRHTNPLRYSNTTESHNLKTTTSATDPQPERVDCKCPLRQSLEETKGEAPRGVMMRGEIRSGRKKKIPLIRAKICNFTFSISTYQICHKSFFLRFQMNGICATNFAIHRLLLLLKKMKKVK